MRACSEDPLALRNALQTLLSNSMGEMRGLVGGVSRNLGKMFITVVTLFFFYRDGERFASQLRVVLEQILGKRSGDYLDAIGKTVKAVLLSLLLCAVSQGVLAGLGYWVAGVPAPIFAAAVTTVAALIPFAVPVVWGSIVIWLFAAGPHAAGHRPADLVRDRGQLDRQRDPPAWSSAAAPAFRSCWCCSACSAGWAHSGWSACSSARRCWRCCWRCGASGARNASSCRTGDAGTDAPEQIAAASSCGMPSLRASWAAASAPSSAGRCSTWRSAGMSMR